MEEDSCPGRSWPGHTGGKGRHCSRYPLQVCRPWGGRSHAPWTGAALASRWCLPHLPNRAACPKSLLASGHQVGQQQAGRGRWAAEAGAGCDEALQLALGARKEGRQAFLCHRVAATQQCVYHVNTCLCVARWLPRPSGCLFPVFLPSCPRCVFSPKLSTVSRRAKALLCVCTDVVAVIL